MSQIVIPEYYVAKDDLDVSDNDKDIYWEIYGDNAEMKAGTISMNELVKNIKFIRED